jgi:histidine triad (HIT) family protein
MNDCIFCKIVAETLNAEVVFDNPEAVAFLDKHPVTRGHVVVIPKVHSATLTELPDEQVGGLFLAVKSVMRKVTSALHPLAMNVGWNHGREAGQHVLHLHVHVLPRFSGGGMGVQALGEGVERLDFAELAEVIRKA